MALSKNRSKVARALITILSDYTLWHQCMIKHLGENTDGGPYQTPEGPTGACGGYENGTSKRLPFPTSRSRAK